MTRDEQWLLEEKYAGDASATGFSHDCNRLAQGEPVAYVIGSQPFLGLKIYLDSKPLIPRVETEWWTKKMLDETKEAFSVVRLGLAARSATENASPVECSLTFLDLCAGSGAIGCATLKYLPDARVYFGEIDPAHRSTIEKNIRENDLDKNRGDIRIGDLFEPFEDMQFDLIAVNPPYVPADRTLPESVRGYEPSQALYAGPDGLDLIRRIADALSLHLVRTGTAWIECDEAHADAARDLFAAHALHAEILTDQYQKPRVIVVSFP